MDWDKDSLIGKAKAAYTSKTKPGIHLMLPVSKMFNCLQVSRTHHAKGKTNIIAMNVSASLSLSFYCWSWCHYGMGYPFGQSGSPVLAVSAPSFLCNPSLLAGRGSRKGFDTASTALTRTSVWYQHFFSSQIQSIAPYRLLWRTLAPCQLKPVWSLNWNMMKF